MYDDTIHRIRLKKTEIYFHTENQYIRSTVKITRFLSDVIRKIRSPLFNTVVDQKMKTFYKIYFRKIPEHNFFKTEL